MIQCRCPWCGKVIGLTGTGLKPSWLNKNVWVCKSCNHLVTFKETFISILLMIALFVLMILLLPSVAASIPLIIEYILSIKSPYIKYDETTTLSIIRRKKELTSSEPLNWYKDYYDLKKDGEPVPVYIKWYSRSAGGIWLPRLRIWNDYIFPMCVVDDQEKPLTLLQCVKISKIKFYQEGLKASIQYINPNIATDILKTGKKFYLFNAGKAIGSGLIE